MIRLWSLSEFKYKNTRHSFPCTHQHFIREVFGLSGLSSLKKHHPTATHCPSHEEPHLFTWPRGAGTLKHTHLYNSMTGFATSLYCLSLAATASGLSSSCWTNGSPVTSSIPCKYQRNPQQSHSGPLNIPKTSFFLKLEFLKRKTNVSKNQMASLGKTLIKEKVCQSCFCYFQILSRSSSKIKLTQVILANQIMTSKVRKNRHESYTQDNHEQTFWQLKKKIWFFCVL